MVLASQHRRYRDGACIDHGVERAICDLVEHDGVEGLASRFHAHMAQHKIASMFLKRIAIHKGL